MRDNPDNQRQGRESDNDSIDSLSLSDLSNIEQDIQGQEFVGDNSVLSQDSSINSEIEVPEQEYIDSGRGGVVDSNLSDGSLSLGQVFEGYEPQLENNRQEQRDSGSDESLSLGQVFEGRGQAQQGDTVYPDLSDRWQDAERVEGQVGAYRSILAANPERNVWEDVGYRAGGDEERNPDEGRFDTSINTQNSSVHTPIATVVDNSAGTNTDVFYISGDNLQVESEPIRESRGDISANQSNLSQGNESASSIQEAEVIMVPPPPPPLISEENVELYSEQSERRNAGRETEAPSGNHPNLQRPSLLQRIRNLGCCNRADEQVADSHTRINDDSQRSQSSDSQRQTQR